MVRSQRAWWEEAGSADRLPAGVKREQGDLVSEHQGGGSRVTGTRCCKTSQLVQMQLLTKSCSGPACRCGTWTVRESMGRAWSEVSRHWQGCVRQAHTVGQSAWLPFPSSPTPRDPNAPSAGIHPFRLLTGVTAHQLGVSLSLSLCFSRRQASYPSCPWAVTCQRPPLILATHQAPSIFLPSAPSPSPAQLNCAALPEILPSSNSLPSRGVTLIPDPNPVLACKAPGGLLPSQLT